MLFINGGIDPQTHALLVPLFGVLIFLHGAYVYLWCRSKRRVGDYVLSSLPFKFLPFLIWLFVSVNVISPVPWLGQMYLIYFFEAFIIFWIFANHINNLKQLGVIFAGLSIPFFIHLYLGFDQFFLGNSFSELGIKKVVSGLFFESSSYVFLACIVIAGLIPAVFLRYWIKVKRSVLFFIFLFVVLSVIAANNFQGFLMLAMAFTCGAYFAFKKISTRIQFLLIGLVASCLAYLVFYFSFSSFGDYFSSAFIFGEMNYFFPAWIASFFLLIKNCLLGVGLGGFEAKLYSVESFKFPLVVSNPNNSYLLILSELGLIGSFFLVKPIVSLFRKRFKQYKTISGWEKVERRSRVTLERFLYSILLSSLLTFALTSLFHPVLTFPFFICVFVVLLAVLNFRIDINTGEIETIKSEDASGKTYSLPKNGKVGLYYFGFACLLGVCFSYDGYKVLKSQDYYENAYSDFQTLLESPENIENDLREVLGLVDDSIKENRYNFDAWLLKSEILNALYNENSIRYEAYPKQMLEASQYVLDRKKNYWKAWVRHGIYLTLVGELDESEFAFMRSIELAPNNFETNFYMGSFLMHFKDRFEEAQVYITNALSIVPTSVQASTLQQKLNL